MDIFVYSDESGVFDPIHNEYFVFSGIICLSKDIKDNCLRKYLGLERELRQRANYNINKELKASDITIKEKRKLFSSMKNTYKFTIIIDQKKILKNIISNKKTKQRYLDYAFKIGLKNALQNLISEKVIDKDEVKNIYIFCDEHNTATNGLYELREGLLQEFKFGTFNWNYNIFFNPLFEKIDTVNVKYLSSEKNPLIRASDIIANRIYFHCTKQEFNKIDEIENLFVKYLP